LGQLPRNSHLSIVRIFRANYNAESQSGEYDRLGAEFGRQSGAPFDCFAHRSFYLAALVTVTAVDLFTGKKLGTLHSAHSFPTSTPERSLSAHLYRSHNGQQIYAFDSDTGADSGRSSTSHDYKLTAHNISSLPQAATANSTPNKATPSSPSSSPSPDTVAYDFSVAP